MTAIDILILSNGPGEITTWVRPVVKALRCKDSFPYGDLLRISVVLSPCPHGTGKEAEIALSYPEVDRVQSAEHFFPFLLWGKTADNWEWEDKGIVIFLGGDQFFPVAIGKRLGYSTVVYAEWDARWYSWIDDFAVRNQGIIEKVPLKYRHKFTVVGDLMADVATFATEVTTSDLSLIGLLPGSKAAKLAQGVPLCLAIASEINKKRPDINFIIPVAPTLDLPTLAKFASLDRNPILAKMGGVSAELIYKESEGEKRVFLQTCEGVEIELITRFPAYDILSQCCLCFTTVGANTAELGSLAVPAIVLIPTQQLDAMRSWDGIGGMLANLPGIGSIFAKLINWLVIKQGRLFAWPNIWANEEILPELVGNLQADKIGQIAIGFLDNPGKLKLMRERLIGVRGQPGAAIRIVAIVYKRLIKTLY